MACRRYSALGRQCIVWLRTFAHTLPNLSTTCKLQRRRAVQATLSHRRISAPSACLGLPTASSPQSHAAMSHTTNLMRCATRYPLHHFCKSVQMACPPFFRAHCAAHLDFFCLKIGLSIARPKRWKSFCVAQSSLPANFAAAPPCKTPLLSASPNMAMHFSTLSRAGLHSKPPGYRLMDTPKTVNAGPHSTFMLAMAPAPSSARTTLTRQSTPCASVACLRTRTRDTDATRAICRNAPFNAEEIIDIAKYNQPQLSAQDTCQERPHSFPRMHRCGASKWARVVNRNHYLCRQPKGHCGCPSVGSFNRHTPAQTSTPRD